VTAGSLDTAKHTVFYNCWFTAVLKSKHPT